MAALQQKWIILNLFISVAYVWVPGAKTTGPIAKTFGVVTILDFCRMYGVTTTYCPLAWDILLALA
jgi:hypothetical protein